MIRQLQEQLASGTTPASAPTAPTATPPATPGSADASADLADYQLAIPPDVYQAIMSEDEALSQKALAHLVSSLARTVHTRVRQEMDTRETALLDRFGQTMTQQDAQKARKAAWDSYYEAFPTHNSPALESVISAEALQIAAENPNVQMDQAFINSLGARVNAKLAAMAGTTVPAPAAPAPPAPPPRPAAFVPANPGPAPSTGSSQEELIADTFGW